MIPNSQHRLIVGDKIDPVWLRFLQSLDGKANASDIAAIATALGSPDGTVANIPDQSADDLRILQAAGIAVTRGTEGEYYIALRPLGDSGAGTFKLITRDTTGRISGSEDGTAADVPYDNTTSGLAAEDVQAAIDELQAEKLGDAPIDGNTYGRRNGGWVNVGSGGSGLTLMGSATVAGSAATDMTVSGLDLASDGAYLVLVNIGNATASSATISLFYNGDTTQTNYYYQFWAGNGAASQASRTNVAALVGLAASSSASGKITVMPDILSGYPRAIIQINRNTPSSIDSIHAAHIRNDGANVTSLTISSSVASSLAVGSYVKVYKLG